MNIWVRIGFVLLLLMSESVAASGDRTIAPHDEAADAHGAAVVATWLKEPIAINAKACPGCCSSHGGITSRCATNGRVYCVDGSVSPSCSCSSCGVATPPPTPTCTGGRVWNGTACTCTYGRDWTGSTCQCSGGRDFTGSACVCSGGRNWTGTSCACPSGQTFTNGQCSASTPTCGIGQVFNGTTCVCPTGQAYDGTRCVAVVLPGNVSGIWYDPAQAGHGLIVEQLAPTALFAVWYTFDPAGQQSWFLGNGAFDGSKASLAGVRPMGARFGTAFDPADVTQTPFGTMQLQFFSCGEARLEFAFPQGFGTGAMNLRRLTQPEGLACGSTAPSPPSGRTAGMTGVWYDPAKAGQGLVVESLPNGTLFVSWFTYGPTPQGGQAWFIGTGSSADASIALSMIKPAGGRFIPNYVASQVAQPVVGTAALQFHTCGSAVFSYALAGEYGSGNIVLSRLTKPQGIVCVDPPQKLLAPSIPDKGRWTDKRVAHAGGPFTGRVRIALDFEHPWRGDLRVDLVSPVGERRTLVSPDPSDGRNDLSENITIDLEDAEVDGTWRLEVEDGRAGDGGRVRSWELFFDARAPAGARQ